MLPWSYYRDHKTCIVVCREDKYNRSLIGVCFMRERLHFTVKVYNISFP